ncbi:MAG TPA: enoyl-CoA hydratase/isomerase family protein [Burkholderiaceae bacterium]|nr:enoyl-CoA hydratase/isomerase family protein [Burkholderiaceae bacterium]
MSPVLPDNTQDDALVLLEKSNGLAVLTLNRPDKLNAMSAKMREAFETHLRDVERDPDIHVVLVQAEGRSFCAGADTSDLPDSPLAWRKRVMTAQAHHTTLAKMDKIVIAAVQGAVAGGGVSLALAADILVMADDAVLHFPFVRLGLIPDGGCSFLLQSKLGVAVALDLMLTAGKMDAEEARQRGLTRRVVPAASLNDASRQLVRDLLSLPHEALMLTKAVSRRTWTSAMDASLSHEAEAFALASTLPGHQKALASIRAKQR